MVEKKRSDDTDIESVTPEESTQPSSPIKKTTRTSRKRTPKEKVATNTQEFTIDKATNTVDQQEESIITEIAPKPKKTRTTKKTSTAKSKTKTESLFDAQNVETSLFSKNQAESEVTAGGEPNTSIEEQNLGDKVKKETAKKTSKTRSKKNEDEGTSLENKPKTRSYSRRKKTEVQENNDLDQATKEATSSLFKADSHILPNDSLSQAEGESSLLKAPKRTSKTSAKRKPKYTSTEENKRLEEAEKNVPKTPKPKATVETEKVGLSLADKDQPQALSEPLEAGKVLRINKVLKRTPRANRRKIKPKSALITNQDQPESLINGDLANASAEKISSESLAATEAPKPILQASSLSADLFGQKKDSAPIEDGQKSDAIYETTSPISAFKSFDTNLEHQANTLDSALEKSTLPESLLAQKADDSIYTAAPTKVGLEDSKDFVSPTNLKSAETSETSFESQQYSETKPHQESKEVKLKALEPLNDFDSEPVFRDLEVLDNSLDSENKLNLESSAAKDFQKADFKPAENLDYDTAAKISPFPTNLFEEDLFWQESEGNLSKVADTPKEFAAEPVLRELEVLDKTFNSENQNIEDSQVKSESSESWAVHNLNQDTHDQSEILDIDITIDNDRDNTAKLTPFPTNLFADDLFWEETEGKVAENSFKASELTVEPVFRDLEVVDRPLNLENQPSVAASKIEESFAEKLSSQSNQDQLENVAADKDSATLYTKLPDGDLVESQTEFIEEPFFRSLEVLDKPKKNLEDSIPSNQETAVNLESEAKISPSPKVFAKDLEQFSATKFDDNKALKVTSEDASLKTFEVSDKPREFENQANLVKSFEDQTLKDSSNVSLTNLAEKSLKAEDSLTKASTLEALAKTREDLNQASTSQESLKIDSKPEDLKAEIFPDSSLDQIKKPVNFKDKQAEAKQPVNVKSEVSALERALSSPDNLAQEINHNNHFAYNKEQTASSIPADNLKSEVSAFERSQELVATPEDLAANNLKPRKSGKFSSQKSAKNKGSKGVNDNLSLDTLQVNVNPAVSTFESQPELDYHNLDKQAKLAEGFRADLEATQPANVKSEVSAFEQSLVKDLDVALTEEAKADDLEVIHQDSADNSLVKPLQPVKKKSGRWSKVVSQKHKKRVSARKSLDQAEDGDFDLSLKDSELSADSIGEESWGAKPEIGEYPKESILQDALFNQLTQESLEFAQAKDSHLPSAQLEENQTKENSKVDQPENAVDLEKDTLAAFQEELNLARGTKEKDLTNFAESSLASSAQDKPAEKVASDLAEQPKPLEAVFESKSQDQDSELDWLNDEANFRPQRDRRSRFAKHRLEKNKAARARRALEERLNRGANLELEAEFSALDSTGPIPLNLNQELIHNNFYDDEDLDEYIEEDEEIPERVGNRKMFFSILAGERIEVALTDQGRLCEYYLDMEHQEKLKGNIYKGIIQNIDVNLQAAFVNYGNAKNGFLQIDEIHPEYWLEYYEPTRNSKFPPIQNVIKPGQEVLVQVVKEPNGNKGAFLTTKLSLAGRFLVLTPGQEQIGVSRKVVDEAERARLKELVNGINPGQDMGVIVRTVSEGTTKTTLKNDLLYLKRIWREIRRKATEVPAPAQLYNEPGLIERSLRDYCTYDVSEIWVDDAAVEQQVRTLVEFLFPKRQNIVRLYNDNKRMPIWDRFNLRRQIEQVYSREVTLPSGGRLVFDQTEALMAIDVNSGKISCKGNFENMAFKTNMEAAESIAQQLRLRDVGGQVVIDFIEMREKSHVEEVEKTLRQAMKLDRARYDMMRMSTFGLLELVRQRTGFSALSITQEPCPFCGGTGQRRNLEWQALTISNEIQKKMRNTKGPLCVYETTPELGMYLLNHKREMLQELEQLFGKKLEISICK